MDQHSNECDLDHIYEVPQYGDEMKRNDYEHYYEPTAANWFVLYSHAVYSYMQNTTF